jgi:hypothetical protein
LLLLHNRNEFLRQQKVDCSRIITRHPFWHSVYIGFGFLNNKHNLQYDDSCADNKAHEMCPTVEGNSLEYEILLKQEVQRLWKRDPEFICQTIAAKIGIMFYYLICFANIGLIAFFFLREGWLRYAAFAAAGAFLAIPGILVMPYQHYVLGFIALAAMFKGFVLGRLLDRSFPVNVWVLHVVRLAVVVFAVISIANSVKVIRRDMRSWFPWNHAAVQQAHADNRLISG